MANLRTNNLSGEQGQNAYRGSVQFNGIASGEFLTLASSSDFDFSTGDVTVEAWVFMSSHPSHSHIFSTQNFDLKVSSGNIRLFTTSGETDSSRSVTVGQWHHIAAVRGASINSGNWVVYLNGIGVNYSLGSVTSGDSVAEVSGRVRTDDEEFHGFISNLRVVNGTAVYTSDFTPPTSELTIIPNTVLLCCQDSDDPTQEATGKTITANGNFADLDFVKQQPVVIPKVGVDAGNTFGGPIQQSSQGYMYFPTGRTEERGRGRALFLGGNQNPNTPKIMDTIDYVEMRTSGVGVRFGSLTTTCTQSAAFASSTRGINAGGSTSAPGDNQTNIIEFVTIATEGNGTDFGDLDTAHRRLGGSGHSSETRGIITGGSGDSPGETNVIQFVTIASIGNATDFGDLLNPKDNMMSKNGSSTRMLICGGRDYTPSATVTNVIEFLTIATTGNSADFGDLTQARYAGTGCGSATRGVIAGGQTPTYVNTIDFVTIASAGNATDFGDLTATNSFLGGASNSIIGIFAGGATPTKQSSISSIEIATTGNAVAFGDNTVTNPVTSRGTCSDSHGGLS